MIEAAMLIALGFLSAALQALATLPALLRRAERLARRRAEAAFPLSLSEIAADRDHLRAELALRERASEQRAQSGFAAKAGAMEQIGRRDMTIGRLERERAGRDGRIAALEGDLVQTRKTLDDTSGRLSRESADHKATAATLAERIDDLAALEKNLAETRLTLKGTGADLDARSNELGQLRGDNDSLRVSGLEAQAQIMMLDGKRGDLSAKLAAKERAFEELTAALAAMSHERDAERLRADALSTRAAQAEAGLAAADVRDHEARAALAHEAACEVLAKELSEARNAWSASEGRYEAAHAEVQTLQGSLAEARADRARLKREIALLAKPGIGKNDNLAEAGENSALRQEIVRIAERLMTMSPKQEAAE